MSILINDRRRFAAVGLDLAGDAPMANEDKVRVQALTTYMEGHEHKNERSEPYEVTRAHAVDLTANGFACIVSEGSVAKREPPEAVERAEDARAEPAVEGAIDNDGKPRGRRGPSRI